MASDNRTTTFQESKKESEYGYVRKVSGPVVVADGIEKLGNAFWEFQPKKLGVRDVIMGEDLHVYSNSESSVYAGCERGNEIAEVAFPVRHVEFAIKRMAPVAIMPVPACEATVYTGFTTAEYFRDMGMNVSMMADFTSPLFDELREIPEPLAGMLADSGYPAYLSAKPVSLYECAGKMRCLGSPDQTGGVTIVGDVSTCRDVSNPVSSPTISTVQMENCCKHITYGPRKNHDHSPPAKKMRTQLQTGATMTETTEGVDQSSTVHSSALGAAAGPPTPLIAEMKEILKKLCADESPSVVTVSYSGESDEKYSTGFVLLSEPGYCLIFTTSRATEREATALKKSNLLERKARCYAVYFGNTIPEKKVSRLLYNQKEDYMILIVLLEDGQTHRPVKLSNLPATHESVVTIGAIAGTKIYHSATTAIHELTGALGFYEGTVSTPSWKARDGWGQLEVGSGDSFTLTCPFQDSIIDVFNIDNKIHPAKLIHSAPIFRLNGEVIGVISGIDESSDVKVAQHTTAVISCILRLCRMEDGCWKEHLKNKSGYFMSKLRTSRSRSSRRGAKAGPSGTT